MDGEPTPNQPTRPRLTARPALGWAALFPGQYLPRPRGLLLSPLAFALALSVLAGALFLTRLACPLLEPEETRYAEIPRQMLAAGRFVEPVWHGAPYYHKPPLLYWLVMGSYCLFGVHDWAARLVPALAAVATVLVTGWWGRRLAGPAAGILGAVTLCLSPRFVYLGRMLTMDGLLCLWVVTALAAAHAAVARPVFRRRWWLVSALACGLGVLTKGPVALVLVLGPVLLLRALDRRTCRPSPWAYLAYLAVAVAVAAPWYLAAAACDPAAAVAFFWEHNVRRYVAPLDHAKPFWFYLPGLLTGTLPWSLLLLPLAGALVRRSPFTAAWRTPALGFFLLAALWCLLFFSLSGCKRAGYLLPALPPLALALGCLLAGTVPWHLLRPCRRLGVAHAAALLAVLLGVVGSVAAVVTGVMSAGECAAASGCLALVLAAWAWRGVNLPVPLAWGLCAATMFVVLSVGLYHVLPGYHRKFGLRGQVRRHLALVSAGRLPVVCYPHRWDSVSFYLQRDDVEAYGPSQREEMIAGLRARPRTLLFVKSDGSLRELLRALPPALEFVPCGRQGGFVTAGLVRRRAE